ncbi:hypothetical protein H4R33_004831 [Dimargaris cristalligena]|uniref:Aldehyde dehydrogenase n=1 Tax=Dimargaris cristalligena TaxID=215637 RepID=A0A4V1J4N7_9FUNG|nr:hypothetical protein H4R33_004831 [Dimargaris cristalligena]RKP36199.1 aldehyde dehydrogenase [Dimargaris cristalligena]|eukprot:RKP36199.1 aldehyde dehydrogenase [Dimargaris cristalligena]
MSDYTVISPYSGEPILTRSYADRATITDVVKRAEAGHRSWRAQPLSHRLAVARRFLDEVVARRDALATSITQQMGRPSRYTQGEVNGLLERTRYLISIAETSLAPHPVPQTPSAGAATPGFTRYITKEPLGVVLVIAPWNFPYLVAINAVLPALLAGNSVVLKHSPQTPLCGELLVECFNAAGVPTEVCQACPMNHTDCDWAIETLPIHFVCFTGSVPAGRLVAASAAKQMLGTGLELGGKDPAYVRADADVAYAVEQLVDGACFNSGQSCCSIERIYVHTDVYQTFVDQFAKVVGEYRLGDPRDPATTLGPVVHKAAAERIRAQVAAAVAAGAQPLIDEAPFRAQLSALAAGSAKTAAAFVIPQVLVNVTHAMAIMQEETFGPVVGIMPVDSDATAIQLMNDSRFGLTASVWTQDLDAAVRIGQQVETGTWFMNRCDYLDPALAWTATKESGRGCTLSAFGFDQFTRLKSYHLKH